MIFIVDIKNDPKKIAFIFQQKELPESIGINSRTKLNTVEYNGGIITNQIIGIYQQPIEWEGCFFGSYPNNQYAKERADELKLFLGRPLKFIFATPTSNSNQIPENSLPKTSGDEGVYIIEEYDIKINNYADVDYRIKLIPHVSQSQAKPKEIEIQTVKISEETVVSSADNIIKAKSKTPQSVAAKKAGVNSKNVLKPQSVEQTPGVQQGLRVRQQLNAQ